MDSEVCADQTGLHFSCPSSLPLPVAQANVRPDTVVVSLTKLTLAVLEDKMDLCLDAAQLDLKNKLEGGLFAPVYQGIKAIMVAAVAGTKIQFGVSNILGEVRQEVMHASCSLSSGHFLISLLTRLSRLRWQMLCRVTASLGLHAFCAGEK